METVGDFFQSGVLPVALMVVRAVVPFMALYVVWRCYTSFKKGQRRRDPVIMLVNHEARTKFPVLYWENSIGRSKSCDIILPDAMASRDHAVLLRRDEGWIISDTASKTGVLVNGKKINHQKVVGLGDEITIGGTMLELMHTDGENAKKKRFFRGFSQEAASPFKLMFVATLVHLMMALQLSLAGGEFDPVAFIPFGAVAAIGWALYIYSHFGMRRVSFEIETMGFLLSGIGIMLMAGHDMTGVRTQIIAMLIGVVVFSFLIWFMGDLERAMKWRLAIGIAAILLFCLNMVIGKTIGGSKNWIVLGPLSIQPSELIKIAFIIFGASTLDRLQTKQNTFEFVAFTGICLGFLFLMKDFGTAIIFFACFLIIAFMRSGSIRTIILAISAAVGGVLLILLFADHVVARFNNWGHIWEAVNEGGYQQTRMLTYFASGGFFGVGLGEGYFKGIVASESDMVFGLFVEEQGLLFGLVFLFALVIFVMFARSDVTRSRSTFYSITACGAVGLMLFQTCLNLFGSTDLIPFTGVTLPFLSAGGSSMMSCWGMIGFLKASDERTYAARRMTRKQIKEEEMLEQERREREQRARSRNQRRAPARYK